jgi:hypothetical protein
MNKKEIKNFKHFIFYAKTLRDKGSISEDSFNMILKEAVSVFLSQKIENSFYYYFDKKKEYLGNKSLRQLISSEF